MISNKGEHIANQLPELKPAPPVLSLQTSEAQTIARAIVANALEWVGVRLSCDKVKAVEYLNRGDLEARRELKLGFARYLAEYLGFLDEDVKAVYVTDHIDNYRGESSLESPHWIIHLVVFADPKTAALTSLISALKRALVLVMDELVEGAETEDFLDVQLVNSADLENLARSAALLTAPNYNPTRIWQRERHERPGKHKTVVASSHERMNNYAR